MHLHLMWRLHSHPAPPAPHPYQHPKTFCLIPLAPPPASYHLLPRAPIPSIRQHSASFSCPSPNIPQLRLLPCPLPEEPTTFCLLLPPFPDYPTMFCTCPLPSPPGTYYLMPTSLSPSSSIQQISLPPPLPSPTIPLPTPCLTERPGRTLLPAALFPHHPTYQKPPPSTPTSCQLSYPSLLQQCRGSLVHWGNTTAFHQGRSSPLMPSALPCSLRACSFSRCITGKCGHAGSRHLIQDEKEGRMWEQGRNQAHGSWLERMKEEKEER